MVLGFWIACAPGVAGALNQLPDWINRSMGVATLAIVAIYLLWLIPRPRTIGRNGWQLTLPSAGFTLVQIALGAVDLGLTALGMYVLVAGYAPVDLLTALGSYVVAALLGFASHAPGSLGVFDAAMLLALPMVEKEKLLAALLIFGCLYYLVPFGAAIAAFCLRELWLAPPI